MSNVEKKTRDATWYPTQDKTRSVTNEEARLESGKTTTDVSSSVVWTALLAATLVLEEVPNEYP